MDIRRSSGVSVSFSRICILPLNAVSVFEFKINRIFANYI